MTGSVPLPGIVDPSSPAEDPPKIDSAKTNDKGRPQSSLPLSQPMSDIVTLQVPGREIHTIPVSISMTPPPPASWFDVLKVVRSLFVTAIIPTAVGVTSAYIIATSLVSSAKTALLYSRTRHLSGHPLLPEALLDDQPICTVNDFIEGMHSVGAVGLVQTVPGEPGALTILFWATLIGRAFACSTAAFALPAAYGRKEAFWPMLRASLKLMGQGFKYVSGPLIFIVGSSTIILRAFPIYGETTIIPIEDKTDVDFIRTLFLVMRIFEQSFILVCGAVCYIGFVRLMKLPWVFSSLVVICLCVTGFSAFYTFVIVPIFRLLESDAQRVLFRVCAWPFIQELFVGIPRVVARRVPCEVVPKENQVLLFECILFFVGFTGRFLLVNLQSSTWVIIANVLLVVVEIIYRLSSGFRDKIYLSQRGSVRLSIVFSPIRAGTYKCFLFCLEFVLDVASIPTACLMVYLLNVTVDRSKPPVPLSVIALNGSLQLMGEVFILLLMLPLAGIKEKLVDVWWHRSKLTVWYISLLSLFMPWVHLNVAGLFCVTLAGEKKDSLGTIYCP